MKNPVLLFWLAVLLLFAGGMSLWVGVRMLGESSAPSGSTAEHAPPAPPANLPPIICEFQLTERSGQTFDSHELDGQPYVVSFFWATCPSTCRMQNTKIAELAREYGPRGVRFLSITCDPDRDTPDKLREYSRLFDADPKSWLFLTGDLLYTRRIGAEMYQVAVDQQTHTDRLAIVDRQGKVRDKLRVLDPTDFAKIKSTLDTILNEPADAPAPAEPASTAAPASETPDSSSSATPAPDFLPPSP